MWDYNLKCKEVLYQISSVVILVSRRWTDC